MRDLISTDFLLCPVCRMTFPGGTATCEIHGQALCGDPLLGATLCGYTVVGILGEGIYATTHRRDAARMAVRILPQQLGAGWSVQDVLSALRTAYVSTAESAVLPTDGGVLADGRYFYLFPWSEQLHLEPLLNLLRRAPCPLDQAVAVTAALCTALQEAHDAGLHPNDLLGESLLVSPPDQSLHVQFLDLGVGRRAADGGSLAEPPSYVHALGMLLHLLATGVPATAGAPPSTSLPQALSAVVLRALDHARQGRYAGLEALHEDLLGLQGSGMPASAQARLNVAPDPPPAGGAPNLGPAVSLAIAAPLPGSRGRRTFAAAGVAVAVAGLGGFLLGERAMDSGRPAAELGQALQAPRTPTRSVAERPLLSPERSALSLRTQALGLIRAARRDGDPRQRREVARLIGLSGDRSLRPLLEEMLKDVDPGVAGQAAWALGELGDPAAGAALGEAAGNRRIHLEVGASLLRLGERQRGMALLRDALRRESGGREREAAFWLGEQGNVEAWGVLKHHLAMARRERPLQYLEILGRLCQGRDQAACQLLRERLAQQGQPRLLAAMGLMRAGDILGYQALHEFFADPDLRLPALTALAGRDLAREEEQWLAQELGRPEGPDQRRAILAEALGAAGAGAALPALTAALTESGPRVRLAAAGAVIRLAVLEPIGLAGQALDWALAGLTSSESVSRRAAAGVLGGMPPAMALPALSRLAQDPDTGVRMAALRALGRLDTQEARDLLRARLREGAVVTASERVLAAGVLLSRGDRGAATVTVLDQALGSANARVRQLAIGQLRHLPDEQQALRLLVRGLADGAEPVRLHAAVELARRGDRRGLEVLRAHQGSLLAEHLMVRDALQRLDTPVPPLELAAVLGAAEQEQREAVMAAAPALLPETGLALVLYGLCDPASGVRLLAVEAAADLPGDGRLRQLLLQPARDQDGAVRGRALAALASLAVNQAAVQGG